MLQAICNVLSDHFSHRYIICRKQELASGDTHRTKLINNDVCPVFIKYNIKTFLSAFMAEADQLKMLARSKSVRVPKVYGVGQSRDHSFLLLEYLPHQTLTPQSAYQLGQQLAELHKWSEQPNFGFDFDNDLDTIPQPNNWTKRWNQFFAEQRIGWQLQIAAEHGHYFGNIDLIVDHVKKRLHNHNPIPSLLHGDLWPTNCGLAEIGPVLFDPACYWGDRECDLAMLPMYPLIPRQIYDGYQTIWPLAPDYQKRQPLYQLYYLLNKSHNELATYQTVIDVIIKQLLNKDRNE